ncbi:MAG: hypothetical protein D3925_15430 [Candidatus Electrothrix sp. AR5]|nr:hypothetical protein [Candidatus Electrothrix sp. AR5]
MCLVFFAYIRAVQAYQATIAPRLSSILTCYSFTLVKLIRQNKFRNSLKGEHVKVRAMKYQTV